MLEARSQIRNDGSILMAAEDTPYGRVATAVDPDRRPIQSMVAKGVFEDQAGARWYFSSGSVKLTV